jgi:TRAP-type C4-dicarboxylate transport system permease small subunit
MQIREFAKKLASRIIKTIDNLSEITGYAGGLALFVAAVVIVHLVITRYMLIPTVWQEELARYLLITAAFVGAAYTQKQGGHISCDIVTTFLPPKPKGIVHLVGSVVTAIVVGVIAWNAWPWWWEATEAGWHTETSWGPPLVFPYVLIPLGTTFLLLQYIVDINRQVTQIRDLFKNQQNEKHVHDGKEV